MLDLERNSLRPTHRHARRRLVGARSTASTGIRVASGAVAALRGLCSIDCNRSFYRVPDCECCNVINSDQIDCTHSPPVGSPLANPTTRYSPAHNRLSPQHASSSMHSRRSQAATQRRAKQCHDSKARARWTSESVPFAKQ